MPQPPIHGPLRQRLAPPALTHRQRFHVFLEVEVEVLEDEIQFMPIRVHDVEQFDDGGVAHLFQQGDLADGGRGHAFVFGFEADFLQRNDGVVRGREVARFVDYAVCAW